MHTLIEKALSEIDWHRTPYGLYEPIEYTLATGGKRLRPTLVLTAAALYAHPAKGTDTLPAAVTEALPAALAIEVFHNFTLLHDDVMDHAAVRRGKPTVHARWDDNTAILSGDQMMIEAYKLLSGVPEAKLSRVLHLFNRMATEICEGQQYDMEFEHRPIASQATRPDSPHAQPVTLDEYMEMIRLKTSVLLATALQIGAYMAGADEDEQKALYLFGIHIGLAFQIQDDILDVYGDPKTFGKAIGGDILCNKKTCMLIKAFELADPATRAELTHWLESDSQNISDSVDGNHSSSIDENHSSIDEKHSSSIDGKHSSSSFAQEKIQAVTSIYTRLGVRKACEQIMQQHTTDALAILELRPQNAYTDRLRHLAERLRLRTV